jgi:hypothetical protein
MHKTMLINSTQFIGYHSEVQRHKALCLVETWTITLGDTHGVGGLHNR